MKAGKRRNVYHTEGLTDLSTFRAEAERRLRGSVRDAPSSTTIHLHPQPVPCDLNPARHEFFEVV